MDATHKMLVAILLPNRRAVLQRAATLAAGAPPLVAWTLPAAANVALDPGALDQALVSKQRELSAPLRSAKQGLSDRLAEEADRLEKRQFRPTVGQVAPAGPASLPVQNYAGKQRLSLADLRGRYVVLWFYPESGFDSGNTAEALQFQRLQAEFTKLDAVVVGCSGQQPAAQRSKLIGPQGLSFPMLADADDALSTAFGARSPIAGGVPASDRTCSPTPLPGPMPWPATRTRTPVVVSASLILARRRYGAADVRHRPAGRAAVAGDEHRAGHRRVLRREASGARAAGALPGTQCRRVERVKSGTLNVIVCGGEEF